MKLDQFESGNMRKSDDFPERPWRKNAPALNKPPSNPNYPTKSFNKDEWMKSATAKKEGIELGDHTADEPAWFIADLNGKIASGPYDSEKEARGDTSRLQWFNPSKYFIDYGIQDDNGMLVDTNTGMIGEDSDQIPEPGNKIRTKKMQMEGTVERVEKNRAGYDEVFFRLADGRLMRTPLENVIVIEKLADEDDEIMEDEELNEISNEVLTKYKTAAAASARDADKAGDYNKGNKRFGGIVKATKKQFANDVKKTKEGTMGGINRSAPATDVSYEKVLDEVVAIWEKEKLDELSSDKLKAYMNTAKSAKSFQSRPLRKLAKSAEGVSKAQDKLKSKNRSVPEDTSFEGRLNSFLDEDDIGDIVRKQNPEKKTDEKVYNGWIIRWQLVPVKPGTPFKWMTWQEKKDPSTAKSGESSSPAQAYQDATAFINAGAGEEKKYTSNRAFISFNVHFTRQVVPVDESFFAKFEDGFLLVSLTPKEGFHRANPYRGNMENEKYYSMNISSREAEEQKLVPNGRYKLGAKDEIDSETSMYDIQFQGVVHSTADKLRMRDPGFTVASPRSTDIEEKIDPWHGYTPDDKKSKALSKAPKSTMQGDKNISFSDMVKDTVATHGVKWAFDYYVKKHGLPPRQFQIYAGLVAQKPAAQQQPIPKVNTLPNQNKPEKTNWWKRLLGKLE